MIHNDERLVTNRRAILVVPNMIKDGLTSPLGLVAIRGYPRRYRGRSVRIDFSFIWRTVEALVGFPYSIYGSVKFSEFLVDRLRQSNPEGNRSLAVGKVSYIASSLHISNDDYGMSIARRIVDEACK